MMASKSVSGNTDAPTSLLSDVRLRRGKYVCPFCELVLEEACQTNCGHRLCRACLVKLEEQEKYSGKSAKCPVSSCGEVLKNKDGIVFFPDRGFQKEMKTSIVQCSIEQIGELQRHKCTKCKKKACHKDMKTYREEKLATCSHEELPSTVKMHSCQMEETDANLETITSDFVFRYSQQVAPSRCTPPESRGASTTSESRFSTSDGLSVCCCKCGTERRKRATSQSILKQDLLEKQPRFKSLHLYEEASRRRLFSI